MLIASCCTWVAHARTKYRSRSLVEGGKLALKAGQPKDHPAILVLLGTIGCRNTESKVHLEGSYTANNALLSSSLRNGNVYDQNE